VLTLIVHKVLFVFKIAYRLKRDFSSLFYEIINEGKKKLCHKVVETHLHYWISSTGHEFCVSIFKAKT